MTDSTIKAKYVYHIKTYWFDTGGRRLTETRKITTFQTQEEADAYIERDRQARASDPEGAWMDEGRALFVEKELVPA